MSMWRTPEVRERIDHRILHGGSRPDGGSLADALCAQAG